MRRIAYLLLTVFLLITVALPSIAFADTPDFSSMSDEEIREIISVAQKELADREIAKSNNSLNNTTLDGWSFDSTYISNDFYSIVESACFKNSIGYTILIHKVLAKQDASLSSSIIATAPDGSVIGKSSDDIVLTAGQYNYFRYSFESDISNATLSAQVKAKSDSFMSGSRNAVEMVQYNQSGDNIYITFKQVADGLGAFAKFKILFYNADKIIDDENGYFNISAENLTSIGATDVASIWVYGIQFDRIEYIFEP